VPDAKAGEFRRRNCAAVRECPVITPFGFRARFGTAQMTDVKLAFGTMPARVHSSGGRTRFRQRSSLPRGAAETSAPRGATSQFGENKRCCVTPTTANRLGGDCDEFPGSNFVETEHPAAISVGAQELRQARIQFAGSDASSSPTMNDAMCVST